jgi:hypothetical protein
MKALSGIRDEFQAAQPRRAGGFLARDYHRGEPALYARAGSSSFRPDVQHVDAFFLSHAQRQRTINSNLDSADHAGESVGVPKNTDLARYLGH